LTQSTRDKVVLITGSRTGIGKETGRLFARKDYKVIFSGKKIGDCKDTVEKLTAEGLKVFEAQIDLTDISGLKENVKNALSIWGKLDLLINNGAIIDPIADLKNLTASDLEEAVKINFVAPTMLINHCWPHLKASKGKILNILSGAATNPIEGWAAYCSTKAALHMINQQAHLEGLVDNIKSIGISPGMVDTNMQEKIRASGVNQISKVKKDELISSETPAKFALWCATAEANEFSGKMISLNNSEVHKKYSLWVKREIDQ